MDYINLVSSLEKKRYTKKDRIITAVQIPLTGIMIGFVVTLFIYLASKIISISNYLPKQLPTNFINRTEA